MLKSTRIQNKWLISKSFSDEMSVWPIVCCSALSRVVVNAMDSPSFESSKFLTSSTFLLNHSVSLVSFALLWEHRVGHTLDCCQRTVWGIPWIAVRALGAYFVLLWEHCVGNTLGLLWEHWGHTLYCFESTVWGIRWDCCEHCEAYLGLLWEHCEAYLRLLSRGLLDIPWIAVRALCGAYLGLLWEHWGHTLYCFESTVWGIRRDCCENTGGVLCIALRALCGEYVGIAVSTVRNTLDCCESTVRHTLDCCEGTVWDIPWDCCQSTEAYLGLLWEYLCEAYVWFLCEAYLWLLSALWCIPWDCFQSTVWSIPWITVRALKHPLDCCQSTEAYLGLLSEHWGIPWIAVRALCGACLGLLSDHWGIPWIAVRAL
jgi:hypothetical protein